MATTIADLVARLRLDNSDLNRNAQSAERTLINLKKTAVAALAGWVSVRGAKAFWDTLIDSVEEYKMSVIQTAAFTTGMMRRQAGISIADQYKEAKEYSEELVYQLELLDAKTILTGNDLKLMNRELLKQGVLLDTNNQKQLEGFTTIANAVAAISAGAPNKQIQLMQETRALLQGQVRMNDQLAMMLDAQTGDLAEQVKLHKQQGDLVEWLGSQLAGFNEATKDIEFTWEAIGTTMQTVARQIIRGGLTEAYQDILGILNDIMIWAREHKDQISSGLAGAWQIVKTQILAIKGLYEDLISRLKIQDEHVKKFLDGWKFLLTFAIPVGIKTIGASFKLLTSYYDATIDHFVLKFAAYVDASKKYFINQWNEVFGMIKSIKFPSLKEFFTDDPKFYNPFENFKKPDLSKTIQDFYSLDKAKFQPDYTLDDYLNEINAKLKEAKKNYEQFGQITTQKKTGAKMPDIASVTTEEDRKDLRKSLLNVAKQKEAYASLIGDIKGMYAAKGEVLKQQLANELADTKKTEEEKYWIIKRYNEEIARIRDFESQSWKSGFKVGVREYTNSIADNVKNVSDAVSGAFKGMEDALVSMVRNGKLEFKDLADSIIADLARIVVRSQITGPLASYLGSMFSGASGAGSYGTAVDFGAYGNAAVAHSGWNVGSGGVRRSVNMGLFSNAPRLHDGLMADEYPAILQRGEEVVSKADVKSRGSSQGVVINIHESPGTKATAEQRSDGSIDIIIEQLESRLAAGINRGNSPLSRSIESQYGVNRAFGARR